MSQPCPPPADAPLWLALGWLPDADQLERFLALQGLLREWNRRVNLTRLVEGDDFWIGQVFDSLWPLAELLPGGAAAKTGAAAEPGEPAMSIIDVGTGCGFPGLALAIALPEARLTLVDSVGRKLEAVDAMAAALGLGARVRLRHERAERTGRASVCRGRFDRALARAVAPAPVVAEYLVPLLRPTGRAVLYRGQWSEADRLALERAAAALQVEVENTQRRDLPGGRGVRHALRLRPLAPCPDVFPRGVGVPRRQPIGSFQ